jgi:hypothetical protein
MNTWLWGPPTWKVLHTLSYAPGVKTAAHADTISHFMCTLTHALPCVYCRGSYNGFTHELQREFGGRKVEKVIVDGEFPKWMYLLHDKVNAKLDKQHAAEVGLAEHPDLARVCRRRQISFECLTKRFHLRPIQFCAEDVFEILQIFGMNMDRTKAAPLLPEEVNVNRERRRFNQLQFFMYLRLVLRMVLGPSEPLMQALDHMDEGVLEEALLPTALPDATMRHVTALKLWYAQPEGFSEGELDALLRVDSVRLTKAFASECVHGSCA